MLREKLAAKKAIQNARSAWLNGQKIQARNWAAMAVELDPDSEETWLLLADLAAPKASVAYLLQALSINPVSQRARNGMARALKRIKQQPASALVTNAHEIPTHPQSLYKIIKHGLFSRTGASISIGFITILAAAIFGLLFMLPTSVTASVYHRPTLTPEPSRLASSNSNPYQAAGSNTPASFDAVQTPNPTSTYQPVNVITPTPLPTDGGTDIVIPPTALPTDGGPVSFDASQPTPVYNGTKKVVVSISQQHMYAYENDELVYSFIVSTGMGGATRVGHFAILDKIPNAYSEIWSLWMPDWLGIYYVGTIENGIHALPILPGGEVLWEGYLGSPASFGCVILNTGDARTLYDWVDLGTPVIIEY